MALLPLASGNEARGFWARTVASSIRRLVRRKSPSSASANSWTAQGVSSDRLLIRRSCVQVVILGRIQGVHALSIPPGTLKQKLWVTGSTNERPPSLSLPPLGGMHGKEVCDLYHSTGCALSESALSRPPQRKRRPYVCVLCEQSTRRGTFLG